MSELDRELGLVASSVTADGLLSPQTSARMLDLHQRFAQFGASAFGIEKLEAVEPTFVAAFVRAKGRNHRTPSVATMHLRRSAVRLLFRTARSLSLVTTDPTLDLELPPRSGVAGRPLSDDEVVVCRTASLLSLTNTRLSATWALAEATARTAELPRLSVADLDLDQGRVWIHGSSRTEPRWGALTEWGVRQLERHLRDHPASRLVYGGAGSAESRQASSCQAIGETLRRAGLGSEPDVRPVSVAAWAGARVLAETGRIEDVARTLGVRSLDRAARIIGYDWHGAS
jgi:integrase/recombinase XerC